MSVKAVSGILLPGQRGRVVGAFGETELGGAWRDDIVGAPHAGAGYAWGTHGVATANLAWRILFEQYGARLANSLYADLAHELLSKMDQTWFVLTDSTLEAWLLTWIVRNVSPRRAADNTDPGVN